MDQRALQMSLQIPLGLCHFVHLRQATSDGTRAAKTGIWRSAEFVRMSSISSFARDMAVVAMDHSSHPLLRDGGMASAQSSKEASPHT
jgi:hypothetical protein